MNFKNLLKNKFFIISICLLVLIIVSASLTRVSAVFFMITCFLACALCIVVGTKFVFDVVKLKKDETSSLLPLTEEQKEKVNKNKKFEKANLIIRIIVFYCFAILFFVLAF